MNTSGADKDRRESREMVRVDEKADMSGKHGV